VAAIIVVVALAAVVVAPLWRRRWRGNNGTGRASTICDACPLGTVKVTVRSPCWNHISSDAKFQRMLSRLAIHGMPSMMLMSTLRSTRKGVNLERLGIDV
jgi:hypothetical protein